MLNETRRPSTLTRQSAEGQSIQTFEDFFEAEHTRLLRAVFLMTADRSEAEDVIQETFLKVWERWDRVRGMDSPTGYLYRTALNAVRSRARRAARALHRTMTPTSRADPMALADDRDQVVQALRRLALRQRIALVLTELLDQSPDEAGKVMGIKGASVRSLASQARTALRHLLEEDHE